MGVLFEWVRQGAEAPGADKGILHYVPRLALGDVGGEQGYVVEETQSCFSFFSVKSSVPTEMCAPGTGPIVICDNIPLTNRGGIASIIRLCCNMDCAALFLL